MSVQEFLAGTLYTLSQETAMSLDHGIFHFSSIMRHFPESDISCSDKNGK
jgi:hypothetical protein